MKKYGIIILLVLGASALLSAEPHVFRMGARPKLQLGFQTGANINYFIYRNQNVQKDVAAGYQGGLFFRISRQKVYAQFEMNYLWSQVFLKNGIFTTDFGNNIPFDNLSFRYHTFGLPFIFGAMAVKKPIFKLRFYNGIESDFILRTKAVLEQNDRETYRLKRNEKRSVLRPEQFSYQLGSGMDIAMFVFDFKYNLGFRSFYKETYRTQTHLFQFTAGVIF